MDPGQVGGTGHWTDGSRGVMTLTRDDQGRRLLAVPKSNYGPSHIKLELRPVRAIGGAVLGFEADGEWQGADSAEPVAAPSSNGRQNGLFG